MSNVIAFRRPARTTAERACQQLREAKTAELQDELIDMAWLVNFIAEIGWLFPSDTRLQEM